MSGLFCIHGHFYQPARENPWLDAVEVEDSASPFHDWNERITAECYRPNSSARMLDDEGRITRLVNNYGRMSFNVGPTLLLWTSCLPRKPRARRDEPPIFSTKRSAIVEAPRTQG